MAGYELSERQEPLAATPRGSGSGASYALFVATLVNVLGIGAVIPVLPLFVKGPIGGGDVAVGLVIGAFSVTGILMRPIAGRIADKRGRKLVHITGIAIAALGAALIFVPAGVTGLIISRLLVGTGEGWVYTAGITWIVDLAPVEGRARVVGLFGLSVWGGITIGAVLGSVILSAAGYEAVWAFAVIAPLIALLIASQIPAAQATAQSASEELAEAELVGGELEARPAPSAAVIASRNQRGLLRWVPSSALWPGTALAMVALAYGSFMSFVVLLLDFEGIGNGALVFTAFTAAFVITRLLFSSVPDRIGSRPTVLAAGLVQAIGMLIVALAGSLPLVLVGAVLSGAGMSLVFPALAVIVIENTDDSRRATALGAFLAFFDIGVGVGAPFAGVIASLGTGNNYAAAFIAAAAISAGGAMLGFFGTGGNRKIRHG
ncbi:MAG: MFS transporter [Solirubrobacteraceae bacterium]|jgi:MFS family permease|nr:MFS transporter [Solirubrobacteraceae bacterium]MDP4672395.1 MFS transporter [Solirubrobacteraceae bacterium]MDP4920673.1 MFS transporter [Solirubrobacteraceae bacterium]